MLIRRCFFTQNPCFKAAKNIAPKGIMIHSTGANNPYLKRYVQPDDGLLGINKYGNSMNRTDTNTCVHAFIGKLADESIGVYQTLPWFIRGWHAGGDANNTHISFEICEDGLGDKEYFKETYEMAINLCVYLCETFSIKPQNVISHHEGFLKGIASNHADIDHWWSFFGVTMDMFRKDVVNKLNKNQPSDWAESIVKQAVKMGFTDGSRPKDTATREEVMAMIISALAKFKEPAN